MQSERAGEGIGDQPCGQPNGAAPLSPEIRRLVRDVAEGVSDNVAPGDTDLGKTLIAELAKPSGFPPRPCTGNKHGQPMAKGRDAAGQRDARRNLC